ncbi:hypothetical protein BGY98DRAFT_1029464 [Russula aff. rugulosa BPL654]|nr:hypothetical protein BGY98DRAFT_1029464 [Russula aff. rugulosa BPL654]
MSGPHPHGSHPGYPPPGYAAFPAPNRGGPMPPRPSNSGFLPMVQYNVRQKVNVRLNADTWVVGIIVGFVHLASLITGRKYRVQFESIEGEGEFFHEDVEPYNPHRPGLVPYRPGG